MTRRIWMGLLATGCLMAQVLVVALVWGNRVALYGAGLGLGSAAMAWLTRLGLREREASLEGRTANRLVGLFLRARRALGRAWRHEPLYLVMGPKQAGKTALLQAGLGTSARVFEAASAPEPQARLVSGQGRTFIEVPSRLFEDGHSRQWRAFLRTLWWLGAARRIKGVLWVQDVSDMGSGGPQAISPWRDVMATLVDALGVRPPVYMVLGHSDAIPGFIEAFGEAPPATTRAPWGFAIDDRDETALTSGHRFDALMDALRAFTMGHLSQADSVGVRAPLYLFPQYVATLRRGLMHAIEATFGTQAQATGARLGGLYFVAVPPLAASAAPETGSLQIGADGTGATHALNAGWEALGPQASAPALYRSEPQQGGSFAALPAATATGAAFDMMNLRTAQPVEHYFVAGLFDDVLAHDAKLDTSVRRAGMWRELLRAPGHLLLVAALISLSCVMLLSFAASAVRIKELGRVVALPWERPEGLAQEALLPLLQAVEDGKNEGPLQRAALAFGMGDTAARDAVGAVYARLLQRDLLSHVLASDQAALDKVWRQHAYAGTAPEQATATQAAAQLRTHLLLTGPKAGHEPVLAGRQGIWLMRALRTRLAAASPEGDDEAETLLRRHLRAYIGLMQHNAALLPPRDETMVSRIRALLQRRPTADLLIDGLIYDVSLNMPSVRLDDIVTSGVVPLVGHKEVPAAFTKEGYEGQTKAWLRAQDTDSDAWIFWATKPTVQQRRAIVRAVRSRYYSRYIESWRDFLGSLVWREPSDVHGGHAMLVALTRSEPPPLRALWRTLAVNTDIHQSGPIAAAAQGMLHGLRRRLVVADVEGAQADAGRSEGPHDPRKALGPQDVATAFAPLLAFGGATPTPNTEREQKALLGSYQDIMQELRGAVENFIEAPQETDGLMQELRRARTQAAGLIQATPAGSGARAVLQQLLLVPLDHMTRALTRGVRAQVVDLWCPAVVQPFAQLAKSYPFNPAGPDASLEDVAAFFHPSQGQAWRFYDEHLRHDVLRQADTFVFDDKLGGVIKRTYRPQLLQYYGKLAAAGQALFAKGAQEGIAADFDVRLAMDKELWETRMEAEGITAHVMPGKATTPWQRVHWPHDGGNAQASLVMVGMGGVKERLDFDGPWALWHLMESGQVQVDRITGIITVTWRPGSMLGHARLDIRPTRANNPFYLAKSRNLGGGVFGYLRQASLLPPRAIGIGKPGCAAR